MTLRLKDIIEQLDRHAPFGLAEKWDNVGLLVGSPEKEVRTILLGLDPTTRLIREAVEKNADVVLTHHPVIFKPLTTIDTSLPEGRLLEEALSHRIAIVACHTNLDSAADGVSDILARRFGLTGVKPLLPTAPDKPDTGLGRIGRLPTPMSADEFFRRAMTVLDLPTLQVAGTVPQQIGVVGLCGGSGAEFAAVAHRMGADIYISGEIKHHTARWAEEYDFCIIDGTHYGTEQPAVELLAEKLAQLSAARGWALTILQSETERHPFRYIHQSQSTSQ